MPESIAILKKENQALKAEIDAPSKTVNRVQVKVDKMLRLAPTLVLRLMKVLKALNSLVTALITLTRLKKKQKWSWSKSVLNRSSWERK